MIYLIMDAIHDTYSTAALQRPPQRATRDLRRLDAAQPAAGGMASQRWMDPLVASRPTEKIGSASG